MTILSLLVVISITRLTVIRRDFGGASVVKLGANGVKVTKSSALETALDSQTEVQCKPDFPNIFRLGGVSAREPYSFSGRTWPNALPTHLYLLAHPVHQHCLNLLGNVRRNI